MEQKKRHCGALQLQFEVVELPSEGTTVEGDIPFAEIDLPDEPRRVFKSPLHYRLHFEAVNGGNDLLVRGCLSGMLLVRCDRCEEDFEWQFRVPQYCQMFEKAFGTTIDLADSVREDILICFPQQFLCHEDCRGLCPRCGQNLNAGECACGEADGEESAGSQGDSPWSALDSLAGRR